ncbi:MAG: hypothetical protein QG675_555 [Patescibacteria group bacterium]|jgi:hypothetical protein|nr:hypothetical protein [Patescibacteria group bacterium]
MKALKFRKSLSKLVLDGTKKSTWRLFDDKDIKVGNSLELIVWETLQPFAKAVVTKVVEKPLAKLTEEDKEGHETFDSEREMYDTYSRYYNCSVGPETIIKIIWFELL